MGRNTTAGTRQLALSIAEELRDRLDERVKVEQRTLRTVVERALTYYMDNVPVESSPSIPAPEQPKRGRPKTRK